MDKLRLTRQQLAQFLTDDEQIKQFEALFSVVKTIAPNVVFDIGIDVSSAQADINEHSARGLRDAQDLELLSVAPVQYTIDLAHDVVGVLPYKMVPPPVKSNKVLTWLSM